jgi:hypothetical protein
MLRERTYVKAKTMLMRVNTMLSVDINVFLSWIVTTLFLESSSFWGEGRYACPPPALELETRRSFGTSLQDVVIGALRVRYQRTNNCGWLRLTLSTTNKSPLSFWKSNECLAHMSVRNWL